MIDLAAGDTRVGSTPPCKEAPSATGDPPKWTMIWVLVRRYSVSARSSLMQYFSITFRIIEDEELASGAVYLPAADRLFNPQTVKENTVSKSASTSNVYRVTEIIGTSESSWEDAAKHVVETASKTLRDLRVAEVNKLDLVIVDGKATAFRARVSLSFKYEGKD